MRPAKGHAIFSVEVMRVDPPARVIIMSPAGGVKAHVVGLPLLTLPGDVVLFCGLEINVHDLAPFRHVHALLDLVIGAVRAEGVRKRKYIEQGRSAGIPALLRNLHSGKTCTLVARNFRVGLRWSCLTYN